MRNRAKKDPAALVDAIFAALAAQTVTALGTARHKLTIPLLAPTINAVKWQRDTIAAQVGEMFYDFPLAKGHDDDAHRRETNT